MRETPERQIDADIVRTLKFDTLTTPRHQQDAREHLLRRAAAQVILPPLETTVDERATLRTHAYLLREQTVRLLNLLVLDEGIYQRARRPPCLMRHYNEFGCYAFRLFNTSA